MKKRIVLTAALAACISFAFTKPENRQVTVLIDVSHGGVDHGTTYGDVTEKEIVSRIASKIADANTDPDIKIYFTRTSDVNMNLEQRVKMAKDVNPDILLSLHVNASKNADTNGMEMTVPVENSREKSLRYAAQLGTDLLMDGYFTKQQVSAHNLALLKIKDIPAIVAELGYLSNERDRAYITSESGQTAIAESILESFRSLK